MENFTVPSKEKIQEVYVKYLPLLTELRDNIYHKLQQEIKLSPAPTYKRRTKSFESYYKKLLRKKPEDAATNDSLVCISDIIGVRVICSFLEDIGVVLSQINSAFEVIEVEQKGQSKSVNEFGYESVHVLIKIPNDCLPSRSVYPIPEELLCEIQIRTMLQDAWAEVEHELVYKMEFTPFDMPFRRKLASMNAALSLADIIFQEIRDYQKNLHAEMRSRQEDFYKTVDSLYEDTHDTQNDKNFVLDRVNKYVKGTVDELLLRALQFHNDKDYDMAIETYTKIIEHKSVSDNSTMLSIIMKHRGMAYFSKNDYENAAKDFEMSYSLNPKNFRSVYYEGIIFSIQKKYHEAIDCFNKSLAVNKYQAHAHWRRAAALYEIGEYEAALDDISCARRLGLSEKDLSVLNEKVCKKLKME